MEKEEVIKILGYYVKYVNTESFKIGGAEVGPAEVLAHVRKMMQGEVDAIEGTPRDDGKVSYIVGGSLTCSGIRVITPKF